jgi:hypothetical protein
MKSHKLEKLEEEQQLKQGLESIQKVITQFFQLMKEV